MLIWELSYVSTDLLVDCGIIMTTSKYSHCWGAGTPWKTEAAWMNWLRGALRRCWSKHPLKIAALHKYRVKIKNPNPASAKAFPEVWGGVCDVCKGTFPLSGGKKEGKAKNKIQVDHKQAAGTFRTVEDFQGFFERMFCVGIEDLRLVCADCNKTLAYADKHKISLEEAQAVKQAIAIGKSKQDKQWLEERGIKPAGNAAGRRKQIVEILKGEQK